MTFPLLGWAAAAGAGVLGWQWWKKHKETGGGPLPGTVSSLKQGTTYAVMVALAAGFGSKDKAIASMYLADFFHKSGFDIKQPFAPRDQDAAKAFDAGLTSTWVGVCYWGRSAPTTDDVSDPKVGQSVFTPLPTA